MGFKKPKEVNQLVVSAQLPGRATREGGSSNASGRVFIDAKCLGRL